MIGSLHAVTITKLRLLPQQCVYAAFSQIALI